MENKIKNLPTDKSVLQNTFSKCLINLQYLRVTIPWINSIHIGDSLDYLVIFIHTKNGICESFDKTKNSQVLNS